MIKINLLPGHIIESRRVKALLRVLGVLILAEVAALAAIIWAPGVSFTARYHGAEAQYADAKSRADEVRALTAELLQLQASYAEKATWVKWVDDTDLMPGKWDNYLTNINMYIPSDVVLNGLSQPSGNNLTLTGFTSDLRAAARWYLNMLRCPMVQPGVNSVSFNTSTAGWPGSLPAGPIPKMQQAVTVQVALKPEYLDMLILPGPPGTAGIPGPGGAAGGGGGRMGMGGGGGRMGRGGGSGPGPGRGLRGPGGGGGRGAGGLRGPGSGRGAGGGGGPGPGPGGGLRGPGGGAGGGMGPTGGARAGGG